jgi:NitT/TauT family transport system permease protein
MSRVADLRGKTVVVFAASPWPPFSDVYLRSGGLTRDDVQVDVVDAAALFGTYVAKRADGTMSTIGSALPIAEALRPSKCLLASDAGIAFLSYGLVAREDTIAKGAALRRPIEVEQRASICRALLANPELLLMDEPFGALDAMTRDDLNFELAQIWQDTRKALLFITHSIAEAVFLSDRVVMMSKSPGMIVDTIVIDLPRPGRLALRDSAEFAADVHRIRHHFAELEMTGLQRRLFAGDNETRDVIVVLASALLLWEAGVWLFHPSPLILPAPSAIFAAFLETPGVFLPHLAFTLAMTCLGFGLAVGLGVGIVYWRLLERTIYTLLVALNSIAKVALAPLFVIRMGTGPEPKVAIAPMLAIFPIVIDTVLGLRSVDLDMLYLARVSKASPWGVLTKIRFPCALPSLFAGIKVAISFALVGAIVGKFVAGGRGIGFQILVAQGQFDTVRVFVSLLLLGLVVTVLFFVVDYAERLCLPWHVSQRARHARWAACA